MDSLTSVLLFPEPLKVIMALGVVLGAFLLVVLGAALTPWRLFRCRKSKLFSVYGLERALRGVVKGAAE